MSHRRKRGFSLSGRDQWLNDGLMLERMGELGKLILSARRDNQDAWDELLRRGKGQIIGIARQYFLPGAEQIDLIQEARLGFCKAVKDFNPQKSKDFWRFTKLCIERWVITAVITATRDKHLPLNMAYSFYRPISEFNTESELLVDVIVYEEIEPIDSKLAKIDDYRRLLDNLSLTKLETRVLRLFGQGESYRDIADTLGCSTKSVDNALTRARTKARSIASQTMPELV